MDPEEAERNHVGAPFGPGTAGAAAGRDAAAVKHDRHVVGAFRLAGLVGHHGSAEMETWGDMGPDQMTLQPDFHTPPTETSKSSYRIFQTISGSGTSVTPVKKCIT